MFGPSSLPRNLEAAIRDTRSKKVQVRVEAVRELVPHVDADRARVVRALEGALRDDEPSVRAAAATALADVQGSEALSGLLLTMEDDDGYVRQMAITALGEIGDPRATQRLRRALSDARPEVRFQAVIAFPRVCASRSDALDALVEATHDDDAHVCHIAIRMAEELAGEGTLEERVVARARALLRHDAGVVRIAAAIVTARAGEPEAREVLTKVARGELTTDDPQDEAAAIELCGELGLDQTTSALERRAFGGLLGFRRDRLAWHARVALARMGHDRASREIVGELGSWLRDRRTLAVAAAGRARLLAAREVIASMRGDVARADPSAVDEALAVLSEARP
jgi:HEAT repeat protein